VEDLSLHLLDIAYNSVEAGATRIRISLSYDAISKALMLEVCDNGCGMTARVLAGVGDPFVTTKGRRPVGLGLPFLKHTCEQTGGSLQLDSKPGQGTTLSATLDMSHIDAPPLGDLSGTMQVLLVGCATVHWTADFKVKRPAGIQEYRLDSNQLTEAFEPVPLNNPVVARALVEELRRALKELYGGELGGFSEEIGTDPARGPGQAEGARG